MRSIKGSWAVLDKDGAVCDRWMNREDARDNINNNFYPEEDGPFTYTYLPEPGEVLCGRQAAGGVPMICFHGEADHQADDNQGCTGISFTDYVNGQVVASLDPTDFDPDGSRCRCPEFLGET